jgi:hypothetical protein
MRTTVASFLLLGITLFVPPCSGADFGFRNSFGLQSAQESLPYLLSLLESESASDWMAALNQEDALVSAQWIGSEPLREGSLDRWVQRDLTDPSLQLEAVRVLSSNPNPRHRLAAKFALHGRIFEPHVVRALIETATEQALLFEEDEWERLVVVSDICDVLGTVTIEEDRLADFSEKAILLWNAYMTERKTHGKHDSSSPAAETLLRLLSVLPLQEDVVKSLVEDWKMQPAVNLIRKCHWPEIVPQLELED